MGMSLQTLEMATTNGQDILLYQEKGYMFLAARYEPLLATV